MSRTTYLPNDRLRALNDGSDLPQTAQGSALFADISGFTPVTERLREIYGARRGAEELAGHLNRVYDALIAEVDLYGGSIIGFAGDAITCWFSDDNSTARAAACGFALLTAMQTVEHISLPEDEAMSLGLKVAITTGLTKRFLVGDPDIQRIDALAGTVVARVAIGEELAERGELLVDAATLERLGNLAEIRMWRQHEQERFAVLERLVTPVQPTPHSLENVSLSNEAALSEMIPLFARTLPEGVEAFQIELRPVTALFLRFTGIEYDQDPNAREKLDQLIQLVQQVVARYEGNVLQLTIGDKGSYLYMAFGAPYAHEDDSVRAMSAALDIRDQTTPLNFLEPIQIGIGRGIMRTGAYGGRSRRTYGVLGDEVNLAARLMQRAEPGTILISESMLGDKLDHFTLRSLTPIQVKGKAHPVQVFQLIGPRDRSFEERFYTTPLVGRDDMLTQLDEAFKPLLRMQHAGIINIQGEAGMGKSRLVFEAQQRLQAHMSMTWLIGQADQLNRSPLSAFAYFLRPYFGQQRERDVAANQAAFDQTFADLVASDEANRADLLIQRSFLAGIIGLVIPGSPYEIADEKLRTDNGIAAIKTWARAVSRRGPLVIQLEDAQWLDATSVTTVQQLTYNMEDVPLALILTSRYNDDGSALVIPNIYSVPIHRFDLNRLSDDEVSTVAGAVLHGTISERLTRFISQRAEGNPFFTEQLVLDLQERNVLLETDGIWDMRPNAVADVPTNVNAVLIARLDRLAAQVKAVVQTAAVLGREFEVAILSRMLRETELFAVQAAEREAIWIALNELRYLFRHALLRDAAYNMQARERLKTLHRLAAETIERIYPNDETQYDALLEHWQNAEVTDKILHYSIPVCERLIGITADYVSAEQRLQNALALGETPMRPALLRLLGDATELRGDYPSAIAHYEDCLNATRDNIRERILALDSLGKIYITIADYPKAINWSSQALELAREHHEQLGSAHALNTLGEAAYLQGDKTTALGYYEESLTLYRALDFTAGLIIVVNNLAKIALDRSENVAARAYLEECLVLAEQRGDRRRVGNLQNNLANLSMNVGDYASARSYYEQSLAIARETGDRMSVGRRLGNFAILEAIQGNLPEAQAKAEDSLRERRAIGDRRGIAHVTGFLGAMSSRRMNYADAQNYYDQAIKEQRAINDLWSMADNLLNMSSLLTRLGNYAEAETFAEESLAVYRELQQPRGIANAMESLGFTAFEQEDWNKAHQLITEALDIHRTVKDLDGVSTDLAYLSLVNLGTNALKTAESQMEEAITMFRELEDGQLPWGLAVLSTIKFKQDNSDTSIYALMQEALTHPQLKMQPRTKLSTVVAALPVLLTDERYIQLAELIGLMLEHPVSTGERKILTKLLDELRPHLDPIVLAETLEYGKSLDLDNAIERLIAELH